jgi:RNA polymerase sigma-70 factor (ECF subfamily)
VEPLAVGAAVRPGSTDVDVVRRAARGDSLAFEELVAVRADHSFRLARAILGNESDARDATQDAFISAWRELPRLRNAEHFDAWLRRILVNACRAQIRTRGRVREIAMEGAPDRSDPSPSTSDLVGDTDMLGRAFDRLIPDKRAILVLHYLQHESVAAIAETMGIPVGTVKWRLSEARGALERALLAEGEDRR